MSRKPVRAHPDRRNGQGATSSSKSTNRVRLTLAIAAIAIVVVGGLFASGSDARKSRPRTGTIARTSTILTSTIPTTTIPATTIPATTIPTTTIPATTPKAASGIPQLTLRPRTAATRAPSATLASNRTDPRLRTIGFRSQSRLDDHYAKHGREFGSISKAQYLAMAQDLRDAPLSKTVIEAAQANGSTSRFNRSTGGFIAFNDDLTIRTFFRPDDGEAYFRRAASRPA